MTFAVDLALNNSYLSHGGLSPMQKSKLFPCTSKNWCHVSRHQPSHHLRSATQCHYGFQALTRTPTRNIGCPCICKHYSKFWNNLPLLFKASRSKPAFTKALKTHLFRTASGKLTSRPETVFTLSFLFCQRVEHVSFGVDVSWCSASLRHHIGLQAHSTAVAEITNSSGGSSGLSKVPSFKAWSGNIALHDMFCLLPGASS